MTNSLVHALIFHLLSCEAFSGIFLSVMTNVKNAFTTVLPKSSKNCASVGSGVGRDIVGSVAVGASSPLKTWHHRWFSTRSVSYREDCPHSPFVSVRTSRGFECSPSQIYPLVGSIVIPPVDLAAMFAIWAALIG